MAFTFEETNFATKDGDSRFFLGRYETNYPLRFWKSCINSASALQLSNGTALYVEARRPPYAAVTFQSDKPLLLRFFGEQILKFLRLDTESNIH